MSLEEQKEIQEKPPLNEEIGLNFEDNKDSLPISVNNTINSRKSLLAATIILVVAFIFRLFLPEKGHLHALQGRFQGIARSDEPLRIL